MATTSMTATTTATMDGDIDSIDDDGNIDYSITDDKDDVNAILCRPILDYTLL